MFITKNCIFNSVLSPELQIFTGIVYRYLHLNLTGINMHKRSPFQIYYSVSIISTTFHPAARQTPGIILNSVSFILVSKYCCFHLPKYLCMDHILSFPATGLVLCLILRSPGLLQGLLTAKMPAFSNPYSTEFFFLNAKFIISLGSATLHNSEVTST